MKIDSIRPLVRYVDQQQAVIDTHIITHAMLPADAGHRTADAPIAYVMAEIDEPSRWWSAGRAIERE